ncbi:Sec-independent protein translocase protein TatA [Paenibacillus allorhizoplanae]|uniref:Sec-independent protein translocase protein TatA n=1 Tax=Paenibacillus allorhizoplanae TaxID=2905648 RepID=A0ABM9C1D6_9BACL|nr:twin-arginine translocase TatA/TatE family subunit [Paenibacillus allorhizoplanae]CAH1199636.1 Sec-independent protein translocase protein TatA [Paenibacillus allorhizoplanae]
MGALSPWHIILVAIVALLLFGPNKLPELGRGFGKMFREFKDATNGNGGNSSTDDQPTIVRKEINPEVSNSESNK